MPIDVQAGQYHGSIDGLNPQVLRLSPARIGMIGLRIEGKSAAAVQMSVDQIPTIQITRRGIHGWPSMVIARITMQNVLRMTDAFLGKPESEDGSAGAEFSYQGELLMFLPGAANVVEIDNPGDMIIEFMQAGTAAVFDNLKLYVHTMTVEAVESYCLVYNEWDVDLLGAGATLRHIIPQQNLVYLFIANAVTTNPDRLSLNAGEQRIVDNQDWNYLRSFTNTVYRVESTALDTTIIDVNPGQDPLNALSPSSELRIEGGEGLLPLLAIHQYFNDHALKISVGKAKTREIARVAQVGISGQHVPVFARKVMRVAASQIQQAQIQPPAV